MTYTTHNGYIYIKQSFENYKFKVTINDVDYTDKVIEGKYTKSATKSVGSFEIVFVDVSLNSTINKYDTVKIYHNKDGSDTLRFVGYVEKLENRFDESISYFVVSGRHIAVEWINTIVNGEYSEMEASDILKDLMSKYVPGYSDTYIEDSGEIISINFSNVTMWKAAQSICTLSNMDIYIDENRAVHFFKRGSKLCENEAVVEYDNLIKMPSNSIDVKDTITKTFVYGEDDVGLPILDTKSVSDTITKETVFIDRNISNIDIATSTADGILSIYSEEKERGKVISFLLEDLNPGDKLWITVPTHEIHGTYIIRQFTHDFVNIQTKFELKDETEISSELKDLKEIKMSSVKVINPYKLEHSFNITFDDYSDFETYENVYLKDSSAFLSSEETGTIITQTHIADSNISKLYLLVEGNNIDNSVFSVSVDNGMNYTTMRHKDYVELPPEKQGKFLKVKIYLYPGVSGSPELKSLAVLYS